MSTVKLYQNSITSGKYTLGSRSTLYSDSVVDVQGDSSICTPTTASVSIKLAPYNAIIAVLILIKFNLNFFE